MAKGWGADTYTYTPTSPTASTSISSRLWLCVVLIALSPWIPVAMATAQCPSGCYCDVGLLHVDCQGAGWTEMPPDLPASSQSVNLSANAITHLADHHLTKLSQLRSLDLSNNHISNISSSAFTNITTPLLDTLVLAGNQLQHVPDVSALSELHILDLSRNNLSTWDLDIPLDALSDLDLSFNVLTDLGPSALHNLPNLTVLDLQGNQLIAFSADITNGNDTFMHPLQELNLADNKLKSLAPDALQSLSDLQRLDLSNNELNHMHVEWLTHQENLEHLSLSHNPIQHLPNHAFANTCNLQTLQLCFMPQLSYISVDTLAGLDNLTALKLSNNPKLTYIHAQAFHSLQNVRNIDISNNRIFILHPTTFHNLTHLVSLDLQGNPWLCDCEAMELQAWVSEAMAEGIVHQDLICAGPEPYQGMLLTQVPALNVTCEGAAIANSTHMYIRQIWVKIGSSLVVECMHSGVPRPDIIWHTNRGGVLHYKPHFFDFSVLQPPHERYHDEHGWHHTDEYLHEVAVMYNERLQVLSNGSLYIDYVTRRDGGNFSCTAHNDWGNDTVLVEIRLDYSLIEPLKIESIICGFICALTFFAVTVLTSAIRFVIVFFSEEERKKRKGIREILEAIHDYKTSKVEQLSAYKSHKFGQISAKFDQLAQFKTDKVETVKGTMVKLSEIKKDKVGKIRTYKQATVSNVLNHMYNLREYYTNQMVKVKDNCSQQVVRVRENYTSQLDKFKDYRSHQIDKIRDNYHNQMVRIRDYSAMQMTRLRDQYKIQQLHILKLLELLEVGNCMTVIEAECMRTESMIFDPDLMFDMDENGVPLPLGEPNLDVESSGESEYLTAGTISDDRSSVLSMPYVLSVKNEQKSEEADDAKDGGQDEEGTVPEVQPLKIRKKKRYKKRGRSVTPEVTVDDSCDSLAEVTGQGGAKLAPVHKGVKGQRPRSPCAIHATVHIEGPCDSEEGPDPKDNGEKVPEEDMKTGDDDGIILNPTTLGDLTEALAQTKETIV